MTVRGTQTTASALQRAAAALDAFCEVLAADRPLKLLLACSLAIACAFCLWMFDAHFLLGNSPFWSNPRGIIANSWADMSIAYSGITYFQRETWQLPLFHVSKLGAPAGTNIIFTDGIPWVSLAARLVFRVSGMLVNPLGAFTAFCFAASAMTLTALVATLGQRSLAAAAMASVAGLCMPALLERWGHMSLIAQFEIPLALIFYLRNYRSNRPWWLFAQAAALMLLALWTHAYFFAMVSAIILATILQAARNRAINMISATAILASIAALLGGLIAISGYLQSGGGLAAEGFGVYSMNLLSPFLPQRSGLFSSLRNIIADGTGGQDEGFSYLGAGVLMLLLMTLPRQWRTLKDGLRHHPWMFALFLGFTLFALSNVIYLGTLQLAHIPLPTPVMQFAAIFRASGRFFWPVMYCLVALAIAAPIPFYGHRGVLLLCLAMPLQWIDSAPLRQELAARIRVPEKPHINLQAWQAEIMRHNSVRVLPQYLCLAYRRGWNSEITVQLQLLAAFADRSINSVYSARRVADCSADQRIDGAPQAGARQLSVFLDEFSGFSRMQAFAATSRSCRTGPGLVVCSDIPEEATALIALARTDRK